MKGGETWREGGDVDIFGFRTFEERERALFELSPSHAPSIKKKHVIIKKKIKSREINYQNEMKTRDKKMCSESDERKKKCLETLFFFFLSVKILSLDLSFLLNLHMIHILLLFVRVRVDRGMILFECVCV